MTEKNTKDCVRDLIGKKVVGVLFNALPIQRDLRPRLRREVIHRDNEPGTKTLIFDDGTGFTFNSRGAFWKETTKDIARAVERKERELRSIEADIKDVLTVAGEVTA